METFIGTETFILMVMVVGGVVGVGVVDEEEEGVGKEVMWTDLLNLPSISLQLLSWCYHKIIILTKLLQNQLKPKKK